MKHIITLAFIASLLSACSAEQTTVPTIDTQLIFTQAAETLIAEVTLTANAPTRTIVIPTKTETPTLSPSKTPEPTITPDNVSISDGVQGAECIPDASPETGKVIDVVDGDTIKVILDKDGLTYSIRYIGMDTPENTTKVEYFGAEATQKNLELVGYKEIKLFKDVSETDRYGRLLRYVIADNVFVNYALVAEGFANVASYPPDVSCIETFRSAESKASAGSLGLWGAPPTPIPQATASGGSSGSGGNGGNAVCSCSGNSLNCPDFGTHSSAQACYDYCISQGVGDIHRLDRDNDGSACENLP